MPLKPSYKPMKRTMLDRDVSAVKLRNETGIAPSTYTKLNNGDWVALELIARICDYLKCGIADVVEFVPDKTEDDAV